MAIINKAIVDKIIKEEFQKMMEKRKLTSKLSQINEELDKMNQEDKSLEEVEAGGLKKTMSDTGLEGGGKQHAVKFEKIGTHLKEDEESEVDAEMGAEGPEMGAEMGTEIEEAPMGEFEAKFAEIGKAIDAKMAAAGSVDSDDSEMGLEMGTENPEGAEEMGADAGDDDFEEVEVSDDDENNTEEIEEGGVQQVNEDLEEPIEGVSVAQMTTVDSVNDNMEKDTHVHEAKKEKGTVINEAKKPEAKNIFTEGLDAKKKTALLEEMNRMKRFAGLSKDEE